MQHLIRPPLWSRVYVLVFLTLWTGGLVRTAVVGPPSSVPVVIAMVAFGAVLGWRLLRLGVDAHADDLIVRNHFRTTTIARSDIEGFREGRPPNMPFAAACLFAATTNDGITSLDVTTRLTVLPSSRRRVEQDLSALRTWLADTETRTTTPPAASRR